jgi:hypothetical protein
MRGSDAVLIRKNGYFYRPGWCGYTSSLSEAGRYWRSEAEAHALNSEGVTVHELAEFDAPDVRSPQESDR